ncbi:hypothetical protein CALCODRAFT_360626 [Calocera cornea HHB12733]|uniref:Uncharacterized protein n=1 Tax=Calocera cornea HHB12733 TaxID=1353952 RepID=A0A165EMQ9_9BASI|nr:hypothetical protein CALCODRAFT_360626 [Calocera cornea HHB12733]
MTGTRRRASSSPTRSPVAGTQEAARPSRPPLGAGRPSGRCRCQVQVGRLAEEGLSLPLGRWAAPPRPAQARRPAARRARRGWTAAVPSCARVEGRRTPMLRVCGGRRSVGWAADGRGGRGIRGSRRVFRRLDLGRWSVRVKWGLGQGAHRR